MAKEIALSGKKEIVLTGVNIGDYGKGTRESFLGLIKELDKINGIKRIRISSIEPNLLSDEIIDFCNSSKLFMPHFHIPLQSGSNKILRLMRRRYDTGLYSSRVNYIKSINQNVCIGADVIVGFPGENDAEFQETLDVMNDVIFDSAYTFKYSSRPGTRAAEFEDHVSEKEKQKRLEKVINLQRKHTAIRNSHFIDKIEMVLIEKESKRSNNQWAGRTDSNKWVIFNKNSEKIGDIVPVHIASAHGITLQGKIKKLEEMELA